MKADAGEKICAASGTEPVCQYRAWLFTPTLQRQSSHILIPLYFQLIKSVFPNFIGVTLTALCKMVHIQRQCFHNHSNKCKEKQKSVGFLVNTTGRLH